MTVTRYPWRPNPKPIEAGRMAVAVGDVHGRSDLLEAMLAALAADVRAEKPDLVDCILLGDLIDRGPDSRGCLLLAGAGLGAHQPGPPVRDVALVGNHDDWLLMAIEDRLDDQDARMWQANGGQPTWSSLGVAGPIDDAADLSAALREAMPADLQAVVRGMVPSYRVGDALFVHAGVDPRLPLDEQPREALLWIRDTFLDAPARISGGWPFDVLVVHGHSIERTGGEPPILKHRIGIDTGAVSSGVLTAVEMLGDNLRFVQVSA